MGDEQSCFGAGDGFLLVLGHAATASEPSEGALDHPPSGDELKANRVVGALDDLNGPAADLLDRPAQLGPAIAAIGEDVAQTGVSSGDGGQHLGHPIPILNVGPVNDKADEKTDRIAHLRRIEAVLANPVSDLPALVREECLDLLEQISGQTARIESKTTKVRFFAGANDTARRRQTMPGVGPQTALVISSFAPPMDSFKRERDFAAWLGLVPRQYSSGGKERLGRISKAGQTDIGYLLIIGAMSRLTVLARKSIHQDSWLARLLHRKPPMLVAIALANKMARAIWAMMSKHEDYRDPA